MERRVNKNSFDIYWTPGPWREQESIEKIIQKFKDLYGEENICVNKLEVSMNHHCRWSPFGRLNCLIIQSTWSRKWVVWDTGIGGESVSPDRWTNGFGPYRDYLGSYHSLPSRDMVAYFGLPPVLDDWKHPEELTKYSWPKFPYAGQILNPSIVDQHFEQDYEAEPYVIFRGHNWAQFCESGGRDRGRVPFIKHILDIVKSRKLKEIVLVSGDYSCNVDVLPIHHQGGGSMPRDGYIEEMAKASATLSLPGGADVCIRDLESAGVGRAVIRPPYLADIWGADDPENPFLFSTQCMELPTTRQEANKNKWGFIWYYKDDDLVRQSCEEMVDLALKMIEDKDGQRAMRSKARSWYEKYTDSSNISDYIFNHTVKAFNHEFAKWARINNAELAVPDNS